MRGLILATIAAGGLLTGCGVFNTPDDTEGVKCPGSAICPEQGWSDTSYSGFLVAIEDRSLMAAQDQSATSALRPRKFCPGDAGCTPGRTGYMPGRTWPSSANQFVCRPNQSSRPGCPTKLNGYVAFVCNPGKTCPGG